MPMPATMRVVQIEPAPMPTLTASTPIAISASVASAVATLPAIRSSCGKALRICLTISITPCEWPWAVSTTSTSTCALTRAVARSMVSRAMPTAAPQRSRPSESLQAFGYLIAFWMSLTVIRPLSLKSLIDDQQLLDLGAMQNLARLVERGADRHGDQLLLGHHLGDRPGGVGLEAQVAIGQDADEAAFLAAVFGDRHAGDAVLLHQLERFADQRFGATVIGLTIMPLSERLTRSTSSACSSIDRFLWMMPMPPCCAMAMAISDSVTVSMAALSSGTLSLMFLVRRV